MPAGGLPSGGRISQTVSDGRQSLTPSGVTTPAEAARVAALGYRAALVGTSLMRSADPAAVVRELLAAGRSAMATA